VPPMLARVGLDPGPPAARMRALLPEGDPLGAVPGCQAATLAWCRRILTLNQVIRYDMSFLTRFRLDSIFN